jgi:uncharacterized Tic20 family protein
MGYQALMFWLWIVVMILVVGLGTCLVVPLSIFLMRDSQNSVFAPFVFQMILVFSILGLIGLFFLAGIIGAVFCLLGRNFRYPVIGTWLERHLPYREELESPIDETQEDNWVAGICHATAILQFWGIVTPLLVWFTQKERSARLRFQSMQAFVYQLIALIVYLAGMALYMLSFFGMFFLPFLAGVSSEGGEIQGPAGLLMLGFFVIIMIFWLASMILVPVYYLLAGFASLRLIQGRHFHYPILGGILERRMGVSRKPESAP